MKVLGFVLALSFACAALGAVTIVPIEKTVEGVSIAPLEGVYAQLEAASQRGNSFSERQNGVSFYKRGERELPEGRVVHLNQEYEGLEVYGYGATVYQAGEHFTTYNGKMVEGLEGLVQPGEAHALTELEDSVLDTVKAQVVGYVDPTKELFEITGVEEGATPIIYVDDETLEAKKAFYVRFINQASVEPSAPVVIADTEGNILASWEGLHFAGKAVKASGPGGNKKIGKRPYDKTLDATEVKSGVCTLENTNVKTVDLRHRGSNSREIPKDFPCYEQKQRLVNGGYSALNDAHHYGSIVFAMYEKYYGVSPLKQKPLRLKVHYGRRFENAFWDGKQMTFGDGKTRFYPLTSLDVVCHEVSHGVTEQSSNLQYSGQSGGLNEAFSDIAGKAAEAFSRGYDKRTFNWGVGFDITKGKDVALRYMNDPPKDGRSIDHVTDYKGQNVHYTSGVFNKVFYMLSSAFKNNLHDAFDIFYIANTRYWGKKTTFIEAAQLMLKATHHMKMGKHLPKNDYKHIDFKTITDTFKIVGLDCSGSGENWTCKNIPKPKSA
jgi:vibriolysin